MVAGLEKTVEHHFVQGGAVDRQFEGLAHPRVLAERVLRTGAVVEIDRQALVSKPGYGRQLQPRILAHRLHIGCRQPLDHVEPAGLQVGEPHGRIGDRREHDTVELDEILVPIIGKPIEHDAVLRDTLDKFVGTGADRMVGEITGRLSRLRRYDHPSAIAEGSQQRRERRFQHQFHGVVVNDLDRGHGTDFGLAVRARHIEVPLDAEFDGSGVKRFAILELDSLPELQDEALVAVDPLPLGGELRRDIQFRGDVDKLVAHRGEDNPPGIGARQRRIEHIGVVGEPDAQHPGGSWGGVNRGESGREQEQGGGKESGHDHALVLAHRVPSGLGAQET